MAKRHYTIYATFTVERVFVTEADSEQDAREHPERWEEVEEEATVDRTQMEIEEDDSADAMSGE